MKAERRNETKEPINGTAAVARPMAIVDWFVAPVLVEWTEVDLWCSGRA